MSEPRTVTTVEELQAALAEAVPEIRVDGTISGCTRIVMPPGSALRGGRLEFGSKGVLMTKDNTLEDIELVVPDYEAAVFADTEQREWGTLCLHNVTTTGQVSLIAEDGVRSGHIDIDTLTITAADVRGRLRRPFSFGVEALQGALTIWNRQSHSAVKITAEAVNVSAGTEDQPVRGSGVFVGGFGILGDETAPRGGTLTMGRLTTGPIHADGGIMPGTADLISAGVFVITGATVDTVTNAGPVTTYGQNDMVLDNWGTVNRWIAQAPVTSYGPSGIGFVNFSDIGTLTVTAPIRTFGRGARGFNLYEGTMGSAHFGAIATHGDGSIGIQLAKPLPEVTVDGDISTDGGAGLSLVKGVQTWLKAVGVSIRPGGAVDRLSVGGAITTTGDDVVTVEIADRVGSWSVPGGIRAEGENSDGVHISGAGTVPPNVTITAAHGTDIVEEDSAG